MYSAQEGAGELMDAKLLLLEGFRHVSLNATNANTIFNSVRLDSSKNICKKLWAYLYYLQRAG
jgi:hypothetical protein